MSHDIRWYSPAPLWSKRLQNGTGDRLQKPELLQFKQDDFMAELQTTLEDPKKALDEKRAKGEKYLGMNGSTESMEGPIPLYQPAHERYYLVAASLVCRERGLPDRAVDTTSDEKATFVLRRVEEDPSGKTTIDGESYVEYRWTGSVWERVGAKTRVTDAEKQIAMFPQSYVPRTPVEQMKGKRRLWAGLIPVAKRDTFETAPVRRDEKAVVSSSAEGSRADTEEDGASSTARAPAAPKDDPLRDPRKVKFDTRILGAFRQVCTEMGRAESSVTAEDVRDPIVFAWYDLWEFLGTHLGDVQKSIKDGKTAEEALFSEDTEGNSDNRARRKRALLRVLNTAYVQEMGLGDTAADALRTVGTEENRGHVKAGRVHKVLSADQLPQKKVETEDGEKEKQLDREKLRKAFRDAATDHDRLLGREVGGVDGKETDGEQEPALKTAVNRALGPVEKDSSRPNAPQPPTTDPVEGGTYVVRCLYERPKCPEPLRMKVSKPSERFRLASFFDAKAPARDINITLPSVSLRDLHDSSQSATMVFTEELTKQAEKIQKVAFEELGANGDTQPIDLGRVCSLSIPIITICALVLLLVIVIVLNIVFWWLPFFKICFPLPSSNQ